MDLRSEIRAWMMWMMWMMCNDLTVLGPASARRISSFRAALFSVLAWSSLSTSFRARPLIGFRSQSPFPAQQDLDLVVFIRRNHRLMCAVVPVAASARGLELAVIERVAQERVKVTQRERLAGPVSQPPPVVGCEALEAK
jgi:hypothetical protein